MQARWHRSLLTVLAIAGALSTGSVAAQPLDVTGATCADFVAMAEEDRNQLSLWLAGYYAGLNQRPVLDLDKILAAPAEITALCNKTPQVPLIGPDTRSIFFPPTP